MRNTASEIRLSKNTTWLRVKGIKSAREIFELTPASNGRAAFEYGAPIRRGEPHIVWRRVGTHEVLDQA